MFTVAFTLYFTPKAREVQRENKREKDVKKDVKTNVKKDVKKDVNRNVRQRGAALFVDDRSQDSHDQGNPIMESPIPLGRNAAVGEIRPEMLVRFFR